jgi:uncharacterized membrane protein (UPF0127 family)
LTADRPIPTELLKGVATAARLLWAAIALLFLCMPAGVSLADDAPVARFEELTVETAKGQTTFKVEVSDTAHLRQRGLMYRRDLPADQGMLFDFGKPRPVQMWMKNTYIPLDMIFIRADGTVVGIGADTVPLSEDTVGVAEPVKGVLEVVAGTAARIGLKPGDRIRHRIFGTGSG